MLVPNEYTFVLAIINLLVLYFVLRKLFFKKITAFMDERSNKIRDTITHSETVKAEADKIKAEYESHLNSALKESIGIVNDAKHRGDEEYNRIIAQAREDSEKLLANTRKEIELERQQMIAEVKNYITELTISTASKLIGENMDSAKNKQLIAKFIEEDGV